MSEGDSGLALMANPGSGRASARSERRERQDETNQELHAGVNAPELPGCSSSKFRDQFNQAIKRSSSPE
jgi:hypothetical protein